MRTRESLTSVGTRFLGMTWPRMRDLGPVLVVWAISLGIIVFQRDLGTGLSSSACSSRCSTSPPARPAGSSSASAVVAGVASSRAQILTYVQRSVHQLVVPFDPTARPDGRQLPARAGPLRARARRPHRHRPGSGSPQITPLAESDYIITSLGEELGLIGLFAILCLYMVFVSRGIRIGLAGQDDFGKLLARPVVHDRAAGVHHGRRRDARHPADGSDDAVPRCGGSSLVANWIIVALLLRISDGVRRQPRVVIG